MRSQPNEVWFHERILGEMQKLVKNLGDLCGRPAAAAGNNCIQYQQMSGSGVVRLALCLLAAGIGVGIIQEESMALSRMLQANVTRGYQPRCGKPAAYSWQRWCLFIGAFCAGTAECGTRSGRLYHGRGRTLHAQDYTPMALHWRTRWMHRDDADAIGMREAGFALSSVLRAAGTAIASCILDQIGCAGSPIRHMTRQRALGVGLLLVGASFSVAHEFTEEVSHLDWPALLSSMLPLLGGALLPVQAWQGAPPCHTRLVHRRCPHARAHGAGMWSVRRRGRATPRAARVGLQRRPTGDAFGHIKLCPAAIHWLRRRRGLQHVWHPHGQPAL